MFYLWKDKKSTKDTVIVYITDYKEIRSDGKVKIDKHGFLDVDLVYSGPDKMKCISEAHKLINPKP